jgi:type VI secretion system secreted protein Hcp
MAMDMFLKLDDIKGESVDKDFKGLIDINSWNWAATQSGSSHVGGGTGSGKVQIQDLQISKNICRASPVLLGMICAGTPIKNAQLTVRKAGGKEKVKYLVITMTQAIITSFKVGGDGGGDRLVENISFNFATVKYEYTPQKADGSAEAVVTTGWNIAGNAVL